jgi:hypothetical protein
MEAEDLVTKFPVKIHIQAGEGLIHEQGLRP